MTPLHRIPASALDRDLCRLRHADCTADPILDSLDEALFVHSMHGGHGPGCLQYLGAGAYLSGLNRDYE